MKIALGCDHRGYSRKERIKALLVELGHAAVDFGATSGDSVDYPDHARPAAQAVSSGECDAAILVCGSGTGVSIVANKVKGIRAALCHNEFTARMSREHNNANVLCVGADVIGEGLTLAVVRAWLSAEFEGGRHERRVTKMMDGEK